MDRLCSIGFAWNWNDNLAIENHKLELNEFYSLFGSINFILSSKFGFWFNLHSDGLYQANILRRMIDSKHIQSIGPVINWSKLIPQKVKCFIWRAVLERILMGDTLTHRGIIVSHPSCHLCETDFESTNHLLVECNFTKTVFQWISRWCGFQNIHFTKVWEVVEFAKS